jgi:cytochrome P450
MCRDESYFSSPDDFFPERHQEKVGKLHQGSNGEFGVEYCDPKQMIFGFGRHTCPGEYLADAMLWCAMAYILATFDILPPIDPVTGDALKLEPKFSTGTVRYILFPVLNHYR